MFGLFSEEKKREKKTKWAVAICQEYSDTCIDVMCKVASALRAMEAAEKQGGGN